MTVRPAGGFPPALLLLLLLAGLSAASPALAQRADCASGYRIARGDTLAGLARACNVSPEALRRANPRIDWDILRIGAPVVFPEARAGRPVSPRRGAVYVIRPGDTLDSVADALGVSVGALLEANPGLRRRDLVPGREIELGDRRDGPPPPPPVPEIEMSVQERAVEPGGFATVELEGLPPRAPVTLRATPEGGPGAVEANGRADRRGRATIEIDVPERARGGERWRVEALDPRGRPVARADFRIAGRERRGVTVSGLLTREGVECPALRSDDGELYTLSGPLRGFRAGDAVTVTGRVANGSICGQGTTIEVERIDGDR